MGFDRTKVSRLLWSIWALSWPTAALAQTLDFAGSRCGTVVQPGERIVVGAALGGAGGASLTGFTARFEIADLFEIAAPAVDPGLTLSFGGNAATVARPEGAGAPVSNPEALFDFAFTVAAGAAGRIALSPLATSAATLDGVPTPLVAGAACTFTVSTESCVDLDADGYGAAGTVTLQCPFAGAVDCDDAAAEVNPGAPERCNEVDDDCDGAIDEGFPGLGIGCTVGLGVCETSGVFRCTDDGASLACVLLPSQDASVLRRLDGFGEQSHFGYAVADAGDVDGDGRDDLVVGARQDSEAGASAGAAYLFAGGSGTLVRSWFGEAAFDRFGWSVAGVGDADGDGVPDVAVGAPEDTTEGGSRSGSAWLFSGATGERIHRWTGDDRRQLLGFSVAGAGDVDGDGHADVVAGAPEADAAAGARAGLVRVLSGRTGEELHRWEGDAAGDRFGFSVSGVGDADGDGRSDVVVGARLGDQGEFANTGFVRLFSGATGAAIRTWYGGAAGDDFGWAVAGPGDFDGDGLADVVVGAVGADLFGDLSGAASVFSGATGARLLVFGGDSPGDRFGWSVSGLGDVDGDGVPDLAVGAPEDDFAGSASGAVRVLSGLDGTVLGAFHGEATEDRFGWSAAAAGDWNGDGAADLAVGGFGNDAFKDGAGAVWVLTVEPCPDGDCEPEAPAPPGGSPERCNGLDDDCDGATDEDFLGLGAPCSAGVGACERFGAVVCAADGAAAVCSAEVPPELCGNGVDDDCDGSIDEGFERLGAACSEGVGACRADGVLVCGPSNLHLVCDAVALPPTAEACNGADDDCDGATDEDFTTLGALCFVGVGACGVVGTRVCAEDGSGTVCDAEPGAGVAEICNGADDDCDGVADEDFTLLGGACSAGLGTCAATGTYACASDGAGVACDAVEGEPSAELCNGADDDCDGTADEDFTDLGERCTAGEGACAASGTYACAADGAGVICDAVAAAPGVAEICNGADDDCDGVADEDFTLLGEACSAGLGTCAATGTYACASDGAGVACDAVAAAPGAELCNGADDDCDGTADEDFADLGDLCEVGVGACTRPGRRVCDAEGAGTVCDAIAGAPAGPERAANGVDDDCSDLTPDAIRSLDEAQAILRMVVRDEFRAPRPNLGYPEALLTVWAAEFTDAP